jgi:NADPH:quinone reductase-like Zn-dependent oxidoreductase
MRTMQAVIAAERAAGIQGLRLAEVPFPHAAENDVIVRVHAAGFTPGELDWPGTWTDRAGRDRTPTVPGHEVSGEVVQLGYGTTGLVVGQRVFGITDWCRDGTLAEFVAVEARNLALLSSGVDHTVAAASAISGLTAWQGLFIHGQLDAGKRVLIHGAAGGVGSLAVQLAREVGAHVIGTGRGHHRQTALDLGAHEFIDLDHDELESLGVVDLVFDVLGGDLLDRSTKLVASGGAVVSIAEPPRIEPDCGKAVFFVVEPDRTGLAEIEVRLRDGRLRPVVGALYPLDEAPAAFQPTHPGRGKAVIRVVDDVKPA